MRRLILLASAAAVAAAFSAVPAHGAKPKKAPPPPPKPAPTVPTTIIDETKAEPAKPKKKSKPNIELAMCAVADLAELEPDKLLKLVRKCRKLAKEGKDPTPLDEEQMLVAVCTQKTGDEDSKDEAVEATTCGLKVTVKVEGQTKALSFGADGDYALALRNSKLVRDTKPANGAHIEVTATATPDDGESRTVTAALIHHTTFEAYSHGKLLWFPMPMLTTDFSSSREGYRLGITPIAVAVGWKWFPSPASTGYLGVSPFLAWNLLIPNDTQTLSNGTFVRVNYKAFGAGVLLDASGWFGVGAGLGKTFTSDNRTDFRMWFYFGPKLLGGLSEF